MEKAKKEKNAVDLINIILIIIKYYIVIILKIVYIRIIL